MKTLQFILKVSTEQNLVGFKIKTKNMKELLINMKKEKQVHILSSAIEMLYSIKSIQ